MDLRWLLHHSDMVSDMVSQGLLLHFVNDKAASAQFIAKFRLCQSTNQKRRKWFVTFLLMPLED